ncbi:amino acid ABC transporter substrate-binding protein [Candidatus Gracilibacteria bacterium]|nr:amino acid ABC transporter substrate-binding protein [Candidatus Gracilibacteria bacterium]
MSQPFARSGRDIFALALLLVYAFLAWSTQAGGGAASFDATLVAAEARGSLRVAVDLGFRPFTDLQNSEPMGYDIDLARAVAAKLDLDVTFVPTGFDALYDTLVTGRADVIASALPYAPEQGFRARFSQIYFDAGQVLVAPRASSIAEVGDLATERVAVALGSDADALARRLASTLPLRLDSNFDDAETAIAALAAGEVDAVIVDSVSALIALAELSDLHIVAALSSEPYVLAVPYDAFQLQAEINRALDELRAEGFFERLNEKWMR